MGETLSTLSVRLLGVGEYSPSKRCQVRWLALALAACLAGCTGGDGSAKGNDLPRYDGKDEITAPVGRAGAELVLGSDLTLRIPVGALEQSANVRVSRIGVDKLQAAEPRERRLSDLVKLEPHGLQFRQLVDIELRVPDGNTADERLAVNRIDDEADGEWERLGEVRVLQPDDPAELAGLPADERTLRSARRVQVKSMHFSIYTVVEREATVDVPSDGGPDASDAGVDAAHDSGMEDVPERDSGSNQVILSKLPIDFATACPASGCTVQLSPIALDGVWRECDHGTDPAQFNASSFDFTAACAKPVQEEPTSTRFMNSGRGFDLDLTSQPSECESYNLGLIANRLAEGYCLAQFGAEVGVETEYVTVAGTHYRYDYDDCEGTCSPVLFVNVLDASNTDALLASCQAAAVYDDYVCGLPGEILIPFGPSGVGAMPSSLAGRTWLRCYDEVVAPFTDVDVEAACRSQLANWQSEGASLDRFHADGRWDSLEYDARLGWSYEACGDPAGGTATTLRRFFCPNASEDERWFGATEQPYEVRTIGANNYLLITEIDDIQVYVEVTGPAEDPCSSAAAPSCILN